VPEDVCPGCRDALDPALDGIRSVAFYEGPLRQAIQSLKYRRDLAVADTSARLVLAAWQDCHVPGDLVVPVPAADERRRERGYNQAEALARGFAELAGLPFASAGLRRMGRHVSQVGLSAAERRRNVVGAFAGDPRAVANRAIILLDDVCSTGSTLAACASALRAAGAGSVWGLTLGRAR
jgi:ComF family protein